jgi:hypothetical protein
LKGGQIVALVKRFKRTSMSRNIVHGDVDCTYTVFQLDGKKYLQLDTYGSQKREYVGKKSQSLQFDEDSLRDLSQIIRGVVVGKGN